ncbi:MAG: hypothetical protein K8F52_05280 [Candidatus Scalindua rubra]|nr:hypothetical protein [Candidatus Scalindua rubra]
MKRLEPDEWPTQLVVQADWCGLVISETYTTKIKRCGEIGRPSPFPMS